MLPNGNSPVVLGLRLFIFFLKTKLFHVLETNIFSQIEFAKRGDIISTYTAARENKVLTSSTSSVSSFSKPNSSHNTSSGSVSESFRNDVKSINEKIRRDPRANFTDSEDEGEILYKDDPPPSDDLASKLARRDTIAREREIQELRKQAQNEQSVEMKNDVSSKKFLK